MASRHHSSVAIGRAPFPFRRIEAERVPVDEWSARVDYVFTSGLPSDDSLMREIGRHYRLQRRIGNDMFFARRQ